MTEIKERNAALVKGPAGVSRATQLCVQGRHARAFAKVTTF
jgi:hypothetical protein